MSAETLRRAAALIDELETGAFQAAVADWLDHEAAAWDRTFAVTQSPSAGVDCPPAVNFGDPDGAARNADYHARHALTVAHAYLNED